MINSKRDLTRTLSRRLFEEFLPCLSAERRESKFLPSINHGMRKHAGWETSAPLPTSRREASRELERLTLCALPTGHFPRDWHALLFLFPDLHTDNALDHSNDIEEVRAEQLGVPGFQQTPARRHTRSGWPVALELIGGEAWRRFKIGQINDDELYSVEAQRPSLEQQQGVLS